MDHLYLWFKILLSDWPRAFELRAQVKSPGDEVGLFFTPCPDVLHGTKICLCLTVISQFN